MTMTPFAYLEKSAARGGMLLRALQKTMSGAGTRHTPGLRFATAKNLTGAKDSEGVAQALQSLVANRGAKSVGNSSQADLLATLTDRFTKNVSMPKIDAATKPLGGQAERAGGASGLLAAFKQLRATKGQ